MCARAWIYGEKCQRQCVGAAHPPRRLSVYKRPRKVFFYCRRGTKNRLACLRLGIIVRFNYIWGVRVYANSGIVRKSIFHGDNAVKVE